jgi:hypothetical protein
MDPLFAVHKLNEVGMPKAQAIAEAYDKCLAEVTELVGAAPSRELSIAKTKLEESCFYAKKAMANNPTNHVA